MKQTRFLFSRRDCRREATNLHLCLSRLLAAAAFFALTVVSCPVRAEEPDESAAIAADYCRLLAFVGGSPLSADERRQVAEVTAADFRTDPTRERKADDYTTKFLNEVAHDPPYEVAELRESFRLNVAMLPESEPLRKIVEAHDPTVAFDRARKHLVTERSLTELSEAYAWVAKAIGTPGPGSDFIASERAFLRAQFASLSAARQEAVAHFGRNYPVTKDVLDHMDRAKYEAWITESRQIALKLDAHEASLRLADVCADTFTQVLNNQIVTNGLILNSAANYTSLYRQGYMLGIYR